MFYDGASANGVPL